MTIRRLAARLHRDTRGAALVEFALVLPILAVLLTATFDIGYQMYMRSVINGVVEKASRRAAVGNLNSGQVDAYLRANIRRILPKSHRNVASAIVITKQTYQNFSRINKPERITADTAPLGTYNATDCYEDANNNNMFDAVAGGSGVGGAEDVVYYNVTVSFPRQFPAAEVLGWNAYQSTTSKTIIRNQPYGAQQTPPVRCP